jgi:hypothetical protein
MEDVKGISIILGVLVLSGVITWLMARYAGLHLSRRHPRLTAILCPMVVPAALLIHGYTTFRIEIAQHPGSDWPAMAMLGGIIFAGISALASIPVSVMMLGGRRVRP